MIEDRPKIEVLSWRVATFTDPRHHQNERHSPHKPWITPSKNVTQTKVHPTNHTQQIGEAIKARRDRWYKRSTAGGDWSFESAVCHSHAEKVTPTNGLHPNDSRVHDSQQPHQNGVSRGVCLLHDPSDQCTFGSVTVVVIGRRMCTSNTTPVTNISFGSVTVVVIGRRMCTSCTAPVTYPSVV
jgi:hypothetical protein